MKRYYYFLFLLFLLFSELTFAQSKTTFGAILSHSLTLTDNASKRPNIGHSTGVYGQYQLSKQVLLGLACEHQLLRLNYMTVTSPMPPPIGSIPQFTSVGTVASSNIHTFRIPIWFSFVISDYPFPRPRKTYFTIGYTIGSILHPTTAIRDHNLHGLIPTIHFGRVGIDHAIVQREHWHMTLGLHWEFTDIYSKRYGMINNLGLLVKVGLNR